MSATAGAHIAFMSVPLHGHVNPMLGVVSELAGRGHRVTFATTDDFTALVREAGATALTYTSTFPSRREPGRRWLPADDDGRHAVAAFGRERDVALPQLADAYADDRPDLVVYDTVTAYAPVLARRWTVPEVQFSPTHVFYQGSEKDLGPTPRLAPDVRPCIVAMPPSLQVNRAAVVGDYTFVGPIPWRRAVDGEWTPPPNRRVAFVSLGTTYNSRPEIFRSCIDAFPSTGWHVVVATGDAIDPALIGPLPAHVELRPWVPQVSVLAHADVFVTAGGTGSVLEGLTQGVPLVVVPQGVEQYVTAARVEALGVGRAIRPDICNTETVRAAVEVVTTSDEVRANLAAIRSEIAASGGAQRAADVIEAHLPSTTTTLWEQA